MALRIATDVAIPVRLDGIQPPMVMAAFIVADVYADYGYDAWVTSCTDGRHGLNSLHYAGKALDFRTRIVDVAVLDTLVADIKERLGDEFDVVLENDHLHVEFDV